MKPRLLTVSDLPQALELSASAGWNQTASGWLRLLEFAPESCFGIELDGCLAATATLLPYGRRLAWLGMVLTRRDYQRRGLARQLMTHTLDAASALGIETVKLDATDQGQPLYEKLGFIAERGIERWTWNSASRASSDPGDSVPLESLASLDREAFGVDRMRLLSSLASSDGTAPHASCAPAITANGFALWGPGRLANYLGPCVARDPKAAQALIARCLSQAEGPWMWDVLSDNVLALALARQFGFQPARRLVRMRLGRSLSEQPGLVYAVAGFELG